MLLRNPTRVYDFGRDGHTLGSRRPAPVPLRAEAFPRVPDPDCDSPLAFADSTPTAIECPAEPLRLIQEPMPLADGDAGWDICDEIELPPRGECRYVVELVRGQTLSVEVASAYPIEISVLNDDTYESSEGACQPDADADRRIFGSAGERESVTLVTLVPETGVYDVVVGNPEDWLIFAAVRIIAPPIP